jgi:hypothetical protein
MTFWVLFNLVTSGWYLFFWHFIVHNPKLLDEATNTYLYGGQTLQAWIAGYQGINYTNLYWSLLWFGFSVFQLVVAGFLFWMDRRRREEREATLALEGVPA